VIEIIALERLSLTAINDVLEELGIAPLASADLAPPPVP
jgi:signal recognition particle subunit SEC65